VSKYKLVPLGELCEILDSKRKPVTKSVREKGDIPYYGATGILDYVADYIFDEKLVLLGEDGAKWNAGDRSAFIIEGKSWVNNHAHVLRPNREILLDEWLTYFLVMSDLSDYISGVTVPKLNQGRMREILIPLPPLAEQKKLLHILEQALEHLAQLENATKQKMLLISELRQVTFKNVFEGK
jgi:type I restriction enzyme S subunit